MSDPLSLFPARIAIGMFDAGGKVQRVQMTPEFFRALRDVLSRLGGSASDSDSSDVLADVFSPFMGGTSDESGMDVMISVPVVPDSDLGQMIFAVPESNKPPIYTLTAPASLTPIVAQDRLSIIVTGGTVTRLEYGRGSTFTTIPGLSGMIELSKGDSLRITYAVAPTLKVILR